MHKITPEENQSHNHLEDWNIEDTPPEDNQTRKHKEEALPPNVGGGGAIPPTPIKK